MTKTDELMNSFPFNQMMEQKVWTPNQKLLALSWKQPYAELMLHGKIETRTWNTNYRGWVLICSSKLPYNWDAVLRISGNCQKDRITKLSLTEILHFHYAQAIAIGYLSDCRKMKPEDEDRCFVQYHPDMFCHVYENVQAIIPFPWKGSQGWKEVTHEIKNQIKIS